jgi:hypothetical protein
MKKLLVLALVILAVPAAFAQVKAGGTLYASAKTVKLKSSTGFFAGTKGTLAYGDQVTVIRVDGKWVEVKSVTNGSVSGWTAAANLTAKRITSANTNSASASEIALAGKGFNQEVENAYKSKGALNYADLDKIEAETVAEEELYRFLADGRLSLGE